MRNIYIIAAQRAKVNVQLIHALGGTSRNNVTGKNQAINDRPRVIAAIRCCFCFAIYAIKLLVDDFVLS